MTPDAQQAAIISALGWELDTSPATEMRDGNWYRHGGTFALKCEDEFPDYLNDRNAAIEAVLALCSPTAEQREFCEGPQITFCRNLLCATGWDEHAINGDRAMFAFDAMTASAAHICDALLHTLNLWDDSK